MDALLDSIEFHGNSFSKHQMIYVYYFNIALIVFLEHKTIFLFALPSNTANRVYFCIVFLVEKNILI